MNKFFVDIPKKIESKIKQSKKHFKQYLGDPSPDIFFLNQTNPKEAELKISSLENNKQPPNKNYGRMQKGNKHSSMTNH